MVAVQEAYAKLAALSDARARRVLELIDDLAELEARENAEDSASGREALTRIETHIPTPETSHLAAFIRASRRGIARK